MLLWRESHLAIVPPDALYGAVGVKPPWNQPHVTDCAFRRLPIFFPAIAPSGRGDVWLFPEQSSNAGSMSEVSVPTWAASAEETNGDCASTEPPSGSTADIPWVWPATRLSAPGVEGPKVDPNELSLMA